MDRIEIYCAGFDAKKIVKALKNNFVTGNFGVDIDGNYVIAEDYQGALKEYRAFVLGWMAAN